jgi:hypothetical protein
MAFEKEASAIDSAAERCVNLIERFSEQDPNDPKSDWKNPEGMLAQLCKARDQVTEANVRLEKAIEQNSTQSSSGSSSKPVEEEDLRAAYMDMITDAFANVLDDLRQKEGDDLDVDILVDCLQSGIDLMSQEDRDFFLQDDAMEEEDGPLTPHEERRRQLGYNVESAPV